MTPEQYILVGFVIRDNVTNIIIYNKNGELFKSEQDAAEHAHGLNSDNPFRYTLIPANNSITLN